MFLYDFTIVEARVDLVAERLRARAPSILRAAVMQAGGSDPSPPEVGSLRPRSDGWALPVHWEQSGWPAPFARLDGELEIAPVGGDRTHLSVSASWDTAGARTVSRSESSRSRHETESVVRVFLVAAATLLAVAPIGD
jgi:hypothetical protein